MKKIFLLLGALMLVGAGCLSAPATPRGPSAPPPTAVVTNFETCAAAGNPIMESYPRQCRANGVTYVEEVPIPVEPGPGDVFCTADAKMCPDGSYVGRTGPHCEFTPCPGE